MDNRLLPRNRVHQPTVTPPNSVAGPLDTQAAQAPVNEARHQGWPAARFPRGNEAGPAGRSGLGLLRASGQASATQALQASTSWEQARSLFTHGRMDSATRLSCLAEAARRWPKQVFADLGALGVTLLPNRGVLAHNLLMHSEAGLPPGAVTELLTKLRMNGRMAFAHVAQPLIERHGYSPLQVLQFLGLAEDGLVNLRCDFQINGQPAFAVFADAVLEAHAPAPEHRQLMIRLASSLAESPLSATERAALVERMAQRSDAESLMPMLTSLGLEEADCCRLIQQMASRFELRDRFLAELYSQPESIRLAAALGEQALQMSRVAQRDSVSLTVGVELSNASQITLLGAGIRLALGMTGGRFGSMKEAMSFAVSAWLPMWPGVDALRPHERPEAIEAAFESMEPHVVFVSLFDRAKQHTNERVHAERMAWTLDVASYLGSLAPADLDELTKDLDFLENRRAPELRKRLTEALVCNVHSQDVDTYASFAAAFERPHMRGFAMVLHALYAGQGVPASPQLLKALGQSSFKDSRHLYPALRDLLTLVDTGVRHLSARAIRDLLESAVPAHGTAREVADGLRQQLRLLAVAVASLDGARDEGLKASLAELAERAGVPPGIELGPQLEPLLLQRMPGTGEARNQAQPSVSLLQDRQAPSVLVYRQTLVSALQRDFDDYQKLGGVLRALDRYADAALWSPEPAQAFARLRYATTGSLHLTRLAKLAPEAYQRWQQAVELPVLPMLGSLRAVDTDRADDLFLCGTDVAGSCQGVDENPAYSKALMGYVLDGKYRMLAVQTTEGVTQARRFIRLLMDEQTGKPALFVERLHANAGVYEGDAEDQALLDLARAKAEALGCVLLCAEDADQAGQPYPNKVRSLGNPAPFEYVDALGDVSTGRYALSCSLVKQQEIEPAEQ